MKKIDELVEEAISGRSESQWQLGECYFFGRLGVDSVDVAIRWFTRSAAQGNVYAQWRLGWMYEYGHGFDKDFDMAMDWYEKAAEQHYDEGILGIANLHYYGKGVPVDKVKAEQLRAMAYGKRK